MILRADPLEDTRAIIAQPVPQHIIEAMMRPVEGFVPPACPKCGAADPLLEGVEPSNTWRCANCEARWSEPLPVENQGPNPT